MRGGDGRSGELFSYVDLEKRVRSEHPLRAIRAIVNAALAALEADFAALYAAVGRPSIAPEKLLRAMLLQAFYSIRSERQLTERRSGRTRRMRAAPILTPGSTARGRARRRSSASSVTA